MMQKPDGKEEKTYQKKDVYYKKIAKVFEKYFTPNSTSSEPDTGIPKRLQANGHDICNYLARHRMANYQIQTVMKLDGLIDYEKLARAVRLSIDEEPVFGCRFVEAQPPYWKRLKNIDQVEFCSFQETADLEKAIRNFVESPLDMDHGPMLKVRLIRSGNRDAVCVKVNHACCDGAGAKEYNELLSEIYCTLCDKGEYHPVPRIAGRTDQDRLLKGLHIKNPIAAWNPLQDAPKTTWSSFPWKQGRSKETSYVARQLPLGQLDALHQYGKQRGATINDLVLTAYYRAMFRLCHPPYGIPMDIGSTIDLRRYLIDQKAVAIRNFSGGFTTAIPRVKGESFEDTLAQVVKATGRVKKGKPGLQNAMGGEFVEQVSFLQFNAYYKNLATISKWKESFPNLHENHCAPGLSNVGFVSKSPIRFGQSIATDAYLIPPAVRAPGLLLLACSYNGILTLAISFYKAELSHKNTAKLLGAINQELYDAMAAGTAK